MINALSAMLATKFRKTWLQQNPPVIPQKWSSLHSLSCEVVVPCKVVVPQPPNLQHPEYLAITLELLRESDVITLEEVSELEKAMSDSQMTGNVQIERDITRKCFTEQNTKKHTLTGIERLLDHYRKTGSFKSTSAPNIAGFIKNFNRDLSEHSEEAKQLIAEIVIEQCKSVREMMQKTHNRHSSRLSSLNRLLGQAPVKRRGIEQLIPHDQAKRCRIEQLTSVMIPLTPIPHEWGGVVTVAPREQRDVAPHEQRDFICAATLLTLLVSRG